MKLSVSSYSFSRLIYNGNENQLSIIKMASELGFDGIEFTTLEPHNGYSPLEYAKLLREEADKYKLQITSYAVSADFSKETVKEELETIKRQVDIACLLGAEIMRHDVMMVSPPFPSFPLVLPGIAGACRESAGYAAEKGVMITVENHGLFLQDSIRMEQLYAAVNHPNFGLLLDIGNFLCVDEDPVIAVSRLASYAKLVHMKDFHIKSGSEPNPGEGYFKSRGGNYLRGAITGQGNVPVKQCIDILRDAGYGGCLVLEFEGMEDVLQAIRISIDNLRTYLSFSSDYN